MGRRRKAKKLNFPKQRRRSAEKKVKFMWNFHALDLTNGKKCSVIKKLKS